MAKPRSNKHLDLVTYKYNRMPQNVVMSATLGIHMCFLHSTGVVLGRAGRERERFWEEQGGREGFWVERAGGDGISEKIRLFRLCRKGWSGRIAAELADRI